MNDIRDDNLLDFSGDNVLKVLKALGNPARLKIMKLLSRQPMNIKDISRQLKLSQPATTTYINQLEEAGVVFTRVIKLASGYNKLCFCSHPGIRLFWDHERNGGLIHDLYAFELRVGHYNFFDLDAYNNTDFAPPYLLAHTGGIIASAKDPSYFFHPARTEGDLLAMGPGTISYMFPYNVPDLHELQQLDFSVEANLACNEEGQEAKVFLAVNRNEFPAFEIDFDANASQRNYMPAWYPSKFATFGRMITWTVQQDGAYINNKRVAETTIDQLSLRSMFPVEISLRIECNSPGTGVVFFGKSFGCHNQDLRLEIRYKDHAKTRNHVQSDGERG